jgi:hypothetical protein
MSHTPELGSLATVSPRSIWTNEAADFTPWVAENLDLLAEALEIGGLALVEEEHRVGAFSLDVLAQLDDGRLVAIENQLERSDHTHLGQCLTYAAGVGAYAVVWVLPQLAAEHRAAMDWLNEHTDDEVHFFGVEISVVQIGSSLPAPVFNVVSRPNEWQKSVRSRSPKTVFQNWSRGYEALKALGGQEWTSINALAEIIGTSPGWVGRHFYNRRHEPETIRMFMDDGSIWKWMRHESDSPLTQADLNAEIAAAGITLDGDSRASPEHFVDAATMADRIAPADE